MTDAYTMARNETYWNENGKYQHLIARLQELIPDEGEIVAADCEELERFRVAQNAYYDLYNNGGGNRDADILKLAGRNPHDYRIEYRGDATISSVVDSNGDLALFDATSEKVLYRQCEKGMNKRVLAAFVEQVNRGAIGLREEDLK